jgi:hypothetical protein
MLEFHGIRCGETAESGEPVGIRTRDPMIKSHVLYQLSYGLSASRRLP